LNLIPLGNDTPGGGKNDWRKIYDANRDIIQNPDLIHPGQTLRLP
jgi:nucleoid-associated protein YgaU